MSKRKTHEEYVAEVTLKNPNIEVLGVYVDSKTKILHKCKIDGYEWNAKPNNILNGKGCPKCYGNIRKTQEEYVRELSIANPNVEVLGEYINSHTPILHLCKKHNVKWNASPDNVLHGRGCFECLREKISKKNGKTHEQFVKELREVNPFIVVLGTYVDAKTPILFKCKIDGYEWTARPSNILGGQGCPKCAGNIKKTHDEYVFELSEINPNIEVLGEYINAYTPILHRCKKHNIKWNIAPYNALDGKGCSECGCEKIGNKFRKSREQYVAELLIKNPNLILVGEYINNMTPTLHKCLTHNVEWLTSPDRALLGCGCRECMGEKIGNKLRKTHMQYVEELKSINPNIIVVGEYIGAHIPILHKCKIDGYEWMATPHSILSGNGCPKCHESKGEKAVSRWLSKNGIQYVQQKKFENCKDKYSLPFDFYLPEHNACIEYDGRQHFEPIEWFGSQEQLEYIQMHDKIKTEYCQNNNIKLLRISYLENIEEKLNNFLFI